MQTFFHRELIPTVRLNSGELTTLPDFVLDEAAYLIAVEIIGGHESAAIKTFFVDFVSSDDVLDQNPELANWPSKDRREWLAAARWRVFFLFDCVPFRCAWLATMLQQIDTKASAERVFQRYGLSADYAKLYMEFLTDSDARAAIEAACQSFMQDDVLADFTLDPKVLQRQMVEDFERFKLWASARAKVIPPKKGKRPAPSGAKKDTNLEFLTKHCGHDRDDLANDLLVRATAYYFKARPFVTRLYAANKAKAAMDGGARQILAAHNANPIQSGIRSDGDGYMTTLIPLTTESHEDDHEDFENATLDAREGTEPEVEKAAYNAYLTGS